MCKPGITWHINQICLSIFLASYIREDNNEGSGGKSSVNGRSV